MNKLIAIFVLCFVMLGVKAQTAVPQGQPYGKVDKADLEMTSCPFEKDANAEILFDIASVSPLSDITANRGRQTYLSMERHIRFKIFNEFGKNAANIRFEYPSYNEQVAINDLQAETINLENGKVEFIPVDKKSIYKQKADEINSVLTFTFPDVKPGSIIEYKFTEAFRFFPTWYFQSDLPTRYSEFNIDLANEMEFRAVPHVTLPYVKNVGESTDLRQSKALANIRSLPDELYMGAFKDNLERIEYLDRNTRVDTWDKIGELVLRFNDFGNELGKSVAGENNIIKQAKSLKSDDEKIAFIFDTVRNCMKWNEVTRPYTQDGTVAAWDKKTGNSAEINLIVHNLLKKAGIKAYLLLVSTKKNGKINPANPNFFQFNNAVVYVPVDSTKYYILDASGKFNLYNTVPVDELNSFGLSINEADKEYKMVFMENQESAVQSAFFNAEIKPGGKIDGTADITSYSYNKTNAAKIYSVDGEAKYIKYLCNGENNIKISSLKLENIAVDSLPLTQHIVFGADLTGSDENYIYFNPNLFNLIGANPFTKEDRFSDIDLGYISNFSISGVYKLPSGFKPDALPKSITLVSPDNSIVFKRVVAENDGSLLVKYILSHKKTIYFKSEYQDLRGFYKKMYELLNEQVVLKKSA